MEIQGNTGALRFFRSLSARIAGRQGAGYRSYLIRLAAALGVCLWLLSQPAQAQPQIRDVTIEGTEATFEYVNASPGQLYGVEVSNDLVTWVIFTERTSTDDGVVSFSLDLQTLGASISYFFRLISLDSSGNPGRSAGELPNK